MTGDDIAAAVLLVIGGATLLIIAGAIIGYVAWDWWERRP